MADEITPRNNPEVPPPQKGGSEFDNLPQYPGPSEQRPYIRQPDPGWDSGGGGGGGGENNPIIGWLIFFLIFGVGNAILYSTTGILFIPIPRR